MNILAIGAHPDDIELGCGATLLAHRARNDRVTLLVMTPGEQGPQTAQGRISEQENAAVLLGAEVFWGGFQDGAVPDGRPAVDVIQSVIRETNCEVIYTHAGADTHQDHRATAIATAAAARRQRRILAYEAPTTTVFAPSIYVDAEGLVEGKLNLLRAHFSQVLKNGLVDLEAVEAQARFRGFAARIRNAEAFETERFLWDLTTPSNSSYKLEREFELQPQEVH